jgi:hypothetical protein
MTILPVLLTALFGVCSWLFLQVMSLLSKVAVLENQVSSFVKHSERLEDKIDDLIKSINED